MESESKAGTSNSPQMVGSNIETWCGQFEMNIPFSGSSWDSHVHTGWFFLTSPPLKMSLDWPPPNLLELAPP